MDDNASQTQRQERTPRRPQPVLSCLTCKRMKLKCDRRLPCERCCHNGRASTCAYAPGQEPSTKTTNDATANKRRRIEVHSPPLASEVATTNIDDLQARVQQLERALKAQHIQSAQAAQFQHDQVEVLDDSCSSRTSRPSYEGPENGHLHDQPLNHTVVSQVRFKLSYLGHVLMSTVCSRSFFCERPHQRPSLRGATPHCYQPQSFARIYPKKPEDSAERLPHPRQCSSCTDSYGATFTCSEHLYGSHTALLPQFREL